MIQSLVVSSITHKTNGQIPSNPSLLVTYVGTLPNNKYLSLVDQIEPLRALADGFKALGDDGAPPPPPLLSAIAA